MLRRPRSALQEVFVHAVAQGVDETVVGRLPRHGGEVVLFVSSTFTDTEAERNTWMVRSTPASPHVSTNLKPPDAPCTTPTQHALTLRCAWLAYALVLPACTRRAGGRVPFLDDAMRANGPRFPHGRHAMGREADD